MGFFFIFFSGNICELLLVCLFYKWDLIKYNVYGDFGFGKKYWYRFCIGLGFKFI